MIFELLNEKSLKKLLSIFAYKPGWSFTYHSGTEVQPGLLMIEVKTTDADNFAQIIPVQIGIELPAFVPDSFDWIDWLFQQIMIVEDHEAREFFRVAGVKVYDPHA